MQHPSSNGSNHNDDYVPKIAVRKRGWFRRLLAFVGPAYLVSVGYMDPGNWATDIEGGARLCYMMIMGSHGHWGLDDLVFGQTVTAVRHDLTIPVLIVRSYDQEQAQRT